MCVREEFQRSMFSPREQYRLEGRILEKPVRSAIDGIATARE